MTKRKCILYTTNNCKHDKKQGKNYSTPRVVVDSQFERLIRTGRRERYKTLLLCFCPTQFLITKIVIEGGGSIWVAEKGARSLPLCRPIWNLNPTSAPHLIEQQSRANTRRIGRRILIRIIIRGVSRLMECATELIMRPRNARHHHSSFYENYR